MKLLIATALLITAMAAPAFAQVMVDGYVRSNGTYVSPYIRSNPNGTTLDNVWGR